MKITVKQSNRSSFQIELEGDATVQDLEQEVKKRLSLQNVIMLHKGKVLEDGELKKYKIETGALIDIKQKQPGVQDNVEGSKDSSSFASETQFSYPSSSGTQLSYPSSSSFSSYREDSSSSSSSSEFIEKGARFTPQQVALINELMSLGYEREEVEAAVGESLKEIQQEKEEQEIIARRAPEVLIRVIKLKMNFNTFVKSSKGLSLTALWNWGCKAGYDFPKEALQEFMDKVNKEKKNPVHRYVKWDKFSKLLEMIASLYNESIDELESAMARKIFIRVIESQSDSSEDS